MHVHTCVLLFGSEMIPMAAVFLFFFLAIQVPVEATVYKTCYQMPEKEAIIEVRRDMACNEADAFSMTAEYDSEQSSKFLLRISCNAPKTAACSVKITKMAGQSGREAADDLWAVLVHKNRSEGLDDVHNRFECPLQTVNKTIILTCDMEEFITLHDLYRIDMKIHINPQVTKGQADTNEFLLLFSEEIIEKEERATGSGADVKLIILAVVEGLLLLILLSFMFAIIASSLMGTQSTYKQSE